MFCAHINPDTLEEQSVKEHLEAVSELCMEYCGKISLFNTGKLLGILHDLGKETKDFDDYIRYSVANPKDKSRKGKVDHATAGAKLIYESFYKSGDTYQKFTAQLISLAICSHHGGLIDCIDLNGFDKFTTRMNKEVTEIFYEEAIQNFINECLEPEQLYELFEKSKVEIKTIFDKLGNSKFKRGLLLKFIFSCLIDADRLDTYTFMAGKKDNATTDKIRLWTELADKLESKLENYPKASRIELLRKEISLACKRFAKKGTGIYKLCVPTGGGKTLSSLRYALEHAKEYGKDRILYVIPFTTIIDQNAKEIRSILERDEVILEHHSNLIVDNEDEDYKLLTERWDSPIILTSMVQFLNTLFGGGTQSVRRLHNLANSIIIFDEIQAIPIKCVNMFNNAVNFLSSICNTTVILCTATQPLLDQTDSPIEINETSNIIPDVEQKFLDFRRTKIHDRTRIGGYDAGKLKNFVFEIMEETNSVLVILNTKKAAIEVFKAIKNENELLPLEERIIVYHLSTNMCPAHRIIVLNEIRESLGKSRIICVSTQLIEAGVNVSFESVVRSLAGLDSIAQAAGRCNRHGERSSGNVYIINMNNEDVSKLIDIKCGQDATNHILGEYKKDPKSLCGCLTSPAAIERYYRYYFYKRKKEMDYTMPKHKDITMLEVLAENSKSVESYRDRDSDGRYPLLFFRQAFNTAGESFRVIDNDTTDIIVPYGKGEDIIAKINGNCDLSSLINYLKEAQQYSVSLYDLDFKELDKKQAIFPVKNGGVLALRKEYYCEFLGVTTEEQQQKFLCIGVN